ncbi:MAG: DUF1844 domain-containing protein [Candidatus Krumholzibacteriales bacterium]
MQDNINDQNNREEFLFHHLIAMFQTLALQQLGKLINPVTGKTSRDLNQARVTIDMIDMIREKTRGNLNQNEKQVLDKVLMELQMNYVTEKEREEEEGEDKEKGEGEADESGAGGQEEEPGGIEEEGNEEETGEGAEDK